MLILLYYLSTHWGLDKLPSNFDTLKELVPYETTEHIAKQSEDYRRELFQIPLVRRLLEQSAKHDASQDSTDEAIGYLQTIIQPRKPMLMARSLVQTLYGTAPTQQFAAFTRGKSDVSSRGEQGHRSRAGRYKKREIKLQHVPETNEELDQTFIEDMSAAALPQYAQSLSYEHDLAVDSLIISELGKAAKGSGSSAFTDSSGNVHDRGCFATTGSAAGTANNFMKGIIVAKGECKKNHFVPDCLLIHTELETLALQEANFHNYEVFREYADYNTGMIRNVLGLDIIVTDQDLSATFGTNANSKQGIMFDKSQFLWMYMRRDKMMVSYDRKENLGQGLSFSSRLGFAYGDVSRACKMTLG